MKIDHHLQQLILQKLTASDELMRYTDLKEGDIENSLFSYHLNKLIDRGMVEKRDDGYILSVEGARWLNDNSMAVRQKESPRVFMALVVQNEDGEYLIGQRTGQMKSTINDHMTPSAAYSNDTDLDDQVQQVVDKFVPTDCPVSQKQCGFTQIKAMYHDNAIVRVLFHVTAVRVKNFEPAMSELVNYEWMSREQIAAIDHPSTRILQGLIDYSVDAGDAPISVIAG